MRRNLIVVAMCLFGVLASHAHAAEKLNIVIGYLEQIVPPPPVLSNLDPVPDDEGLAGAVLGVKDNNTTGKFLNQTYHLEARIVAEGGDLVRAARDLLKLTSIIVLKVPEKELLELARLPEARHAILINASAPEIALRSDKCHINILHSIPSRAMLTDAVAQFAARKRWTKWVLLQGEYEKDIALGNAYANSARKFGFKLLAKKTWAFDADMRRSAASELPLLIQDFPDHDLLIVADEADDFARYMPYNTWLPRPIAGSEGLQPAAWSAAVEQHGAAQLQSRFYKASKRTMRPIDYAAWIAVRAVGEAVTRTTSKDTAVLRTFMLSDKYELAGFKGRKLTFRKWNGQLRQPIPLSHPRAVVALAPMEGFLHQRNDLDTLGLDKPDSACTAFGE